jgi:hypothetical protein
VRKPKVTKIKMTFPTLGQEIGIKDNKKKETKVKVFFFFLSLSLLIVMIISTPGGYK